MMNVLAWNVRGIGHFDTLSRLVRKHKAAQVVRFVLRPILSAKKITIIKIRLRFDHCIANGDGD